MATNRKILQLAGSKLATINALSGVDAIKERELIVSTDTGTLMLGKGDGSYKVVGNALRGATAERAAVQPLAGTFFFDTTQNLLFIADGSSWQLAGGLKIDGAVENNVAVFDAAGSVKDSKFSINDTSSAADVLWSSERIVKAITDSVNGMSWQAPVKKVVAALPTADLAEGDRYLVLGGSSDKENKIVTYKGGKWVDTAPVDGMAVFVEDTDAQYAYNGTAWVSITAGFTYHAGNGIILSDNTFTAKAAAGSAVVVDAEGISVATDGQAIVVADSKLKFNAKSGSALKVAADGVSVETDGTALVVADSKIKFNNKADSPITVAADGVSVATDGQAIVVADNQIKFKAKTGSALKVEADGVSVDVDGQAVVVEGGKVKFNAKSGSAVKVEADGVSVATDDKTVVVNASGQLEVKDIDLGTF